MKFMSLLISFFISYTSFACDFSKEITKNKDGSYRYTKNCHLEVGSKIKELSNTKKKLDLRVKIADELEQQLDKKDQRLGVVYKRLETWQEASLKAENKINQAQKLQESNKWLWYGLGIVTMGLATFGAAQIGR